MTSFPSLLPTHSISVCPSVNSVTYGVSYGFNNLLLPIR